jgi:hypothetical protein
MQMDLLLWCCPFLILNLTWATWRMSCRKQRLPTLPEHLSLPPVFWWDPCCSYVFSFKCCLYCFGLVFVVLRNSWVVFDKNRKIIVLRFFSSSIWFLFEAFWISFISAWHHIQLFKSIFQINVSGFLLPYFMLIQEIPKGYLKNTFE